ncbi:hypothetical protein VMCG_02146 [Cytospora schulzeri]|uniref:Uncharacterized protein n=1 Tax=Cytospora schulzeri TaxID=448051 RepID=A0A423X1R7_9PEZI|nr:hypothetical protein VMCG_02146 [Valsa malicola]
MQTIQIGLSHADELIPMVHVLDTRSSNGEHCLGVDAWHDVVGDSVRYRDTPASGKKHGDYRTSKDGYGHICGRVRHSSHEARRPGSETVADTLRDLVPNDKTQPNLETKGVDETDVDGGEDA